LFVKKSIKRQKELANKKLATKNSQINILQSSFIYFLGQETGPTHLSDEFTSERSAKSSRIGTLGSQFSKDVKNIIISC